MNEGELGETRWSRFAARDTEFLVREYWKPIYRFLRPRLPSIDEAEEATQEFFVQFLARDVISRADPARGRFRGLLFQLARQFLVDRHRERSAAKRGGDRSAVPLEHVQPTASEEGDPATEFDRQWFLSLVNKARRRLKAHHAERGTSQAYEAFRLFYFGEPGDPDPWSQKRIAERLDVTVAQVNNAVARGRALYARILREIVAETAGPEDVEDELRELARFLEAHRLAGPPTSTLFGAPPPEDEVRE